MNLSPKQEILQLRDALQRQTVELEHQKRELEIQTSLERVRTVAMSMQKPADMVDICKIISAQLTSLGVREIRNVQTAIIYETKGTYLNFEYYARHDRSFVTEVHYDDHPMSINFVRNMLDDPEGFFTHSLSGEELRSWYAFQKTTKQFADDFLENAHSLNYYWHSAGPVALGISTYYPLRPDETELFRRFRNVFELAYRRYLDIETALFQAREARIELALERVRARTMAMQKSEEMVEASNVLFHELQELGIETIRTGVATVDAEHETVTVWSSQLVDKNEIKILGVVPRNAHPFFEGYLTAWEKKEPYFTFSLSGDEVRSYYHTMSSMLSYPLQSEFNPTETFQVFFFPEGSLNAVTRQPLSEESCQLLVRFARVFGLIYRRFLDLKRAEIQAREAQIELALERVRARTMAMQRSEELSETAQILFQQFKDLGESPIQITIGIFNEPENRIEFNATDWSGEGNQIERTFVAEIDEPTLMQKIYKAWKANKKSVVVDLTGQELLDWIAYRNKWSGTTDHQFQLHHRRAVHVGFFSKGLISFSTHEPRPAESINLLERFASVFNLTFTRFNDLKIAEHHAQQAREDLVKLQMEKKRAEDALSELRTTQTQLIHSEKMASLGELTAGIAHEIQNPLNFVNNFSELNTELIEELTEEALKGNAEEVKNLTRDIKENELKIIFHGKRADAIVKSMLQHSRTSSGKKEPTDLNALADEYLRLAYHGLRAKDKSFNVSMKTDLDPTLPKVNVVPQDIGRVLLNLITNAFQAVSAPKSPEGDFRTPDGVREPTVIVSTKQFKSPTGDLGAEVRVQDNGPGIPQNILDKIFQPFFTTKPVGEGTGLGLSISYDIIKALGGDLKVKTQEGEGAEFIIQLPLN